MELAPSVIPEGCHFIDPKRPSAHANVGQSAIGERGQSSQYHGSNHKSIHKSAANNAKTIIFIPKECPQYGFSPENRI